MPNFQNDDPILLHHCPQLKHLRFALEYHYSPVKLTKAPVDSGAVHQGWEASRTAPKAIAHGRKAKGHVEVLSHARDVERPQVLWCVNDALDNTQKHRIELQHWRKKIKQLTVRIHQYTHIRIVVEMLRWIMLKVYYIHSKVQVLAAYLTT